MTSLANAQNTSADVVWWPEKLQFPESLWAEKQEATGDRVMLTGLAPRSFLWKTEEKDFLCFIILKRQSQLQPLLLEISLIH